MDLVEPGYSPSSVPSKECRVGRVNQPTGVGGFTVNFTTESDKVTLPTFVICGSSIVGGEAA